MRREAQKVVDDHKANTRIYLVQSLNLGPIWQARDSLSPRTTECARRPFLKFAPEPRKRNLATSEI
jgi:hypothetical protein